MLRNFQKVRNFLCPVFKLATFLGDCSYLSIFSLSEFWWKTTKIPDFFFVFFVTKQIKLMPPQKKKVEKKNIFLKILF